jgi:hypothetical protein
MLSSIPVLTMLSCIAALQVRARTFDKVAPYCRTLGGYTGTWWMGYDGKVPGPTIHLAPYAPPCLATQSLWVAMSHQRLAPAPCTADSPAPACRSCSVRHTPARLHEHWLVALLVCRSAMSVASSCSRL